MRDDREKACCRLPLVVCRDRNEFVHRAKYVLVHRMLVLSKTIVVFIYANMVFSFSFDVESTAVSETFSMFVLMKIEVLDGEFSLDIFVLKVQNK